MVAVTPGLSTTSGAHDPDGSRVQETGLGARRWAMWAAALVALLLGGIGSLALVAVFTVFDDPCPGYDDEGTMAAPDSPYSRVMCEPTMRLELGQMTQVPVPMAFLVSSAVGIMAAGLLAGGRTRRTARRPLIAGLVGVLLLQPVVVVTLQYALPRDCLGGPAVSDECGRDREYR